LIGGRAHETLAVPLDDLRAGRSRLLQPVVDGDLAGLAQRATVLG